ncbi:hypothetical protein R1sor_005776 [Riccia sorocarpa]|uniref:Reverse transcriptase domain-containing protein n=1 Tax=Riccia sorocarpa TaxID=122646 RepID=A0ABD3HPD6_9MARC
MKAYDRVAHGFLWDTLEAMGMGVDTVNMIKGLVEGGTSEVHVNGSFTEEIKIGRGVRQGCPLAPLLFAMTTQPLMRALREEERVGNIKGLNLGGGNSLLHQLFADDTGICITAEEEQFVQLKEVIKEFESVSGACLNLQKSVVMQLKPAQYRPGWSRLLSWPAKTLLLKHVLAATPLYQLMSVGLCRDGLEELERLCRNFLWGWNEDGNPKHALIAWERIAHDKGGGGLGWTSFKNMADALHTRLIGRVLEGDNAEWIHLARSFILRTLRRGAYQRESIQWTWQECLILLPVSRIEGSPTLSRILGSWNRTRKRLRWDSRRGELDSRMSLLQIKAIYQVSKGAGVTSVTNGRELGLLRRTNIRNLEEVMVISRESSWRLFLRSRGIFPEEEVLVKLDALEEWCKEQKVVNKNIMDLEGWEWESLKGEFKWVNSTREWRQILAKEVDFSDKMEEKWQGQSHLISWKQRWKLLWVVPIPYRRRIWLWRILQRGFFTKKRAADMGFQDGTCKRCVTSQESVEHILWSCRKTADRRRHLVQLTCPDIQITSLLEWIDVTLRNAQRNPASLLVCINYCWTAWRERNEWQFNHKHVNRPVHTFLMDVDLEIFALRSQRNSEERQQSFDNAREEIARWKESWRRIRSLRRTVPDL